MAENKLTARQKKFANEYLIDLNATRAAKRAGYSAKTAYMLMKNPKIIKYITERQQKLQERTEIKQENVLRELINIAFSNATDYMSIKENEIVLEELEQLPPEKRAAVVSIKQSTKGIEIKLADKMKALELLGKYLGVFNGDNADKSTSSLAQVIVAAYEKRNG